MKKRGMVFTVLLLIVMLPFASAGDIMFKISADTNAHGEISGTYPIQIKYSDIFGSAYAGASPEVCSGTNRILKLSDNTNAHAQLPEGACTGTASLCDTLSSSANDCGLDVSSGQVGCSFLDNTWPIPNECLGTATRCEELSSSQCAQQQGCSWESTSDYSTEVCYGDTVCRATEKDCYKPGELCVVKLSDWTNAHFSTCSGDYPITICCSSGITTQKECSEYTTKSECWTDDTCSWTPPWTNNNAEGGSCCDTGEQWVSGACTAVASSCTLPFTDEVSNTLKTQGVSATLDLIGRTTMYTSDGPLDKDNNRYCAQVRSTADYGIWYNVETY